MSEINIGQKILELRKSKNITLTELSKLTNISTSMLSQIENNLANPSIKTLEAIAHALEEPMFSFFIDGEQNNENIVRADKRLRVLNNNGNNSYYELLTPDLQGNIEFGLMTLNPNSFFFVNAIEHKGEEVGFVMQGRVNVALGTKEEIVNLETGDSIRIPPYTKHRWFNTQSSTAIIVFAISPPSF